MAKPPSTVLPVVQEAISVLTSVEPSAINLTDHFEEDLFMSLEVDVPRVIKAVQEELGIEIPAKVTADFVKEITSDPDKGTVAELVDLVTEELEF